MSVVADCCNPVEVTRQEWEMVAANAGAQCVNIEIVCSDVREHRSRVESRESTVTGLVLPTWEEVERREYHAWTKDRIVVDTAGKTEDECFNELLVKLVGSSIPAGTLYSSIR